MKGVEEMKRFAAALLIILLLAVGVYGCGGGSNSKETEKEENGQVSSRLSEAYAKMMNDGKYLMEIITTVELEDQMAKVEMSMAVDGDNVAITTSSNGTKSTMITKGDKLYIIDHENKTIIIMDEGVEDMNEAAKTTEVSGLKFEKAGQEGGLQYEQYATDSGKIYYYFEGSQLKKIKYVAEDGAVSEMEIVKMTKDFPASLFDIPTGYQKIEM